VRHTLIVIAGLWTLYASCAAARGAEPPNSVGFTMLADSDPLRPYELVAGEYSARPVLLAIWYPAQPTAKKLPLRLGELVDVAAFEPKLRGFARRITEQKADAHALYGLHFKPGHLSADEKRQLAELLAKPTSSIRDAAPAAGRFPVVVYHQGLGGSFDDNIFLAEELARAGFVVVGSVFQPRDSGEIGTDYDIERSFDDIAFLLQVLARRWPQADASRLAVVGQSYGAQVALAYGSAHPGVRAVVSLDSTLENMDAADFPKLADLDAQSFLGHPELLRAPILAFARQPGHWWYLEGARYATRSLVVVAEVEHNDFTSQGALPAGGQREQLYRAVVALTRNHLQAALSGNVPVEAAPLALHVDKRPALAPAPTALSLADLAARDAASALAACDRSLALDPKACAADVIYMAAAMLKDRSLAQAAIALLRWNTNKHPTWPYGFLWLGNALRDDGNKVDARQAYLNARAQLAHINSAPMREHLAKQISQALGE
jgi:predicted dienelactone hydrolase